jgi:hypothetical protein
MRSLITLPCLRMGERTVRSERQISLIRAFFITSKSNSTFLEITFYLLSRCSSLRSSPSSLLLLSVPLLLLATAAHHHHHHHHPLSQPPSSNRFLAVETPTRSAALQLKAVAPPAQVSKDPLSTAMALRFAATTTTVNNLAAATSKARSPTSIRNWMVFHHWGSSPWVSISV